MEHAPPPRRRPRRQPSSSSPTPAAAREPRRCRRPVGGEVDAPPMAPSPPPAPTGAPSADLPAAAETTIDSLGDDIIVEILHHLQSSASLPRPSAVCRSWKRVASDTSRRLHPSSALIGMYSCDPRSQVVSRTPSFHRVGVPDLDIAAVIRGGKDMLLTRLDDGQRWHLRDCRNGVLLLRRDANSLCVYNPVFGGQPVRIQPCLDDVTIDEGEFVADCLLQGTVKQCVAVDSFRVVSVQVQVQVQRRRRDRQRKIRAVVYDSSTSEWHCHEWASLPPDGGSLSIHPHWDMPMYAAGRIFWVYGTAFLYVLDTGTMEFSARHFPSKWDRPDHWYSIGEIPIKDNTQATNNTSYLVCIRGLLGQNQIPMLQLWSLDASDNILKLDLYREIPMRQFTVPSQVCRVYRVINGLAVMTYHCGHHFVVDLEKQTLLAEFEFSGQGYPYQLSWEPAISSGSTPALEDNNIACSQNPYVDPTDGNEGSSNEVALKSPDNPTDDEPLKRKRRKTNVTSNACLGETTMGHQDQHMPSLSRKSGGDEPSKLSLGNEIEPPTLSYLDNASSQSQYVDSPDVSEDSCNEAALCENHYTLESRGNPTDDEPPKSKKRKINNTSNSCPGETTRRTRSSHAVHDITSVEAAATSTPAACQISPQRGSPPEKSRCKEAAHPKGARRTRSSHVVHDITSAEAETTSMPVVRQTTCRKNSIGRPATQEKPVCKKSKRDRHCRVVHVQDKRYPCTFYSCGMKFKRLFQRDSHVERIHDLKKKPLVCGIEGCPEVFSAKHAKIIHVWIRKKPVCKAHVEVGTEPEMYKCHYQGCTSTFPEAQQAY